MQKTSDGNYFEDFHLGQELAHATPRTITEGDVALYTALYGSRFALNCADTFAINLGFEGAPVDDLLVFHVVFGKTVADISINAVANLGYAAATFGSVAYAGDTVFARSQIIGLKENANGKTGVVYVHTQGRNQNGDMLVDYVRWVMVNKRDPNSAAPEPMVPDLPQSLSVAELAFPAELDLSSYDTGLAGSSDLFDDYQVGEKIDHIDGYTIEETEHMMATRLYQNSAKVHFNQLAQKDSRFGRRLVYGGHIISLVRSLSFNGLTNAFKIAAINDANHTNPSFAGDTVLAWSEVLEKAELPGQSDVGALRIRTTGMKNQVCSDFPDKDGDGNFVANKVLDFDYWVFVPRG